MKKQSQFVYREDILPTDRFPGRRFGVPLNEANSEYSAETIKAFLGGLTEAEKQQLQADIAAARQRSNHLGEQAISTITGLQALLNGLAPANHNHDDRYYTEPEIDGLLAPILALIGSEAGDADAFINTIREVLQVFANSPEGFDILAALATKLSLTGTDPGYPITGNVEFSLGTGLKWGAASLIANSGSDGVRLYASNFARLYLNATKELWLQARAVVVGPSDGQIYLSESTYASRTIEANAPVWTTSLERHEQAIVREGSKNVLVPLAYIEKYFALKAGLPSAGDPNADDVTNFVYNSATGVLTITTSDETYSVTLPDAVPLSGTLPGKPVSGNIVIDGGYFTFLRSDGTRYDFGVLEDASFGIGINGQAPLIFSEDGGVQMPAPDGTYAYLSAGPNGTLLVNGQPIGTGTPGTGGDPNADDVIAPTWDPATRTFTIRTADGEAYPVVFPEGGGTAYPLRDQYAPQRDQAEMNRVMSLFGGPSQTSAADATFTDATAPYGVRFFSKQLGAWFELFPDTAVADANGNATPTWARA